MAYEGQEERYEDELLNFVPVLNKNLVCKNCIHKIEDNVYQCLEYKSAKPANVLYGGYCSKHKLK